MLRSIRLAAIAAATLLAGTMLAETYVVPVWATALPASDGEWWASSTVVNPNDFPVTVRVSRVFQLATTDCPSCEATPGAPVTVQSHASLTLQPPSSQAGRRLVAGAFEVETSAPVHIHLTAYRTGANEIRQRLDVAKGWLLPGVRSVSAVERSSGPEWRMNVFVVNPNPTDLHVSVWSADRSENEVRATVAPGTTAVVSLPQPKCSGGPCPIGGVYPIPLLAVHIESDGLFLASVSSVGKSWAVFSLADEAAIAR